MLALFTVSERKGVQGFVLAVCVPFASHWEQCKVLPSLVDNSRKAPHMAQNSNCSIWVAEHVLVVVVSNLVREVGRRSG